MEFRTRERSVIWSVYIYIYIKGEREREKEKKKESKIRRRKKKLALNKVTKFLVRNNKLFWPTE
jgi:hypothetical protein